MEANKTQLHVEELNERIVPNAMRINGPFRIIGDANQQTIHRPQRNDDRDDRRDRGAGEQHNQNAGRNNNGNRHNIDNINRSGNQNRNPDAQRRAQAAARGVFTTTGEAGALGLSRYLQGNIRLPGLGTLRMTGTLHEVGDVLQGRPGGQIVVESQAGSITLQMTAAAQAVTEGLPTLFTFRVVDGTGKFTNTTGQGKVRLVLTPTDDTTGTFSMKFARHAAA